MNIRWELKSLSTQQCVFLLDLVIVSVECLSFPLQNDVRAKTDTRRLFSPSSTAVILTQDTSVPIDCRESKTNLE